MVSLPYSGERVRPLSIKISLLFCGLCTSCIKVLLVIRLTKSDCIFSFDHVTFISEFLAISRSLSRFPRPSVLDFSACLRSSE